MHQKSQGLKMLLQIRRVKLTTLRQRTVMTKCKVEVTMTKVDKISQIAKMKRQNERKLQESLARKLSFSFYFRLWNSY